MVRTTLSTQISFAILHIAFHHGLLYALLYALLYGLLYALLYALLDGLLYGVHDAFHPLLHPTVYQGFACHVSQIYFHQKQAHMQEAQGHLEVLNLPGHMVRTTLAILYMASNLDLIYGLLHGVVTYFASWFDPL